MNNKIISFLLIIFFIILIRILELILNIKNKLEKIYKLNSNSQNNSNDILIDDDNNKQDCNKIISQYIKKQNDFCNFPNKYYNKEFENQITITNFSLYNLTYKFYIYKKNDGISNFIKKNGKFEAYIILNILRALKYYKKKKNIVFNKDIYMLDIGGNIGIYPSYFGRFGYSILSFEPSPINYYISNKNYCNLNEKSNVIIINKGLSNEEKICNYYLHIGNKGNGIILCNEFSNVKFKSRFLKKGNITLSRLSRFIPYLSDKHIAMIKMDIEGGEGKAIESGIELINKYHVPFIVLEFTPLYLKEHGTEPKNLLNLFINNGYKISIKGFFSKKYLNMEKIMKLHRVQTNLFIIHDTILTD